MSVERATKSGFALEAQQKVHNKYDEVLGNQLLSWIALTTGEVMDTSGSMENFVALLKDGTALCKYVEQDPNAVLICLSSLARKSEKLFGKPGLGPKEAAGEKRQWTEEQLRAGDSIIGLQMGSNKGANASGINMGNTRHM
ncbi:hypothetical protein QR680_009245 [Steinernema hermaphroditum]|uniref:Calponin-homology (CH) domain-containing protein n=1 Tax=Steinernema hermaphroditum TaxID=289476 RepID=A0AA39M9C2_9BILA|nr:hypothetical protein QR680_009245 [Steinernema hermaphroditum]